MLITLSQAYKKAKELNMIFTNPCGGVQLPKKESRRAAAFTQEEQERFLSICTNDSTYHRLFLFAFNTGMRLGELMALTWDDVDLTANSVTINKTLAVVNDHDPDSDRKQKIIINSTKTSSGEGIIPLNRKAKKAIEHQRTDNSVNSPFVFYSTVGTPVQKRNIYREFNKVLEQAQITSPVTFHSIRHSFATRLLEKGADIKTVPELLGHKSIQITLDIYGHLSADLKGKTIALLE